MKYTLANGKTISIPDSEVQNIAKGLGLSIPEAVQVWLEDAEFEINEEQEKLDNSASKVKVSKDIAKKRAKSEKTRTVKVSDEKQAFFAYIKTAIEGYCLNHDGNCTVLKENKLISVEIGGKVLKIDLIEQRQPKN
jgi:hypothetical protein